MKAWCKSRFPDIPPGWPAQYQIGTTLPGHLVDEGKLVLFLDEEIASRAPKCGKRRKAEKRRLREAGRKPTKKQKTGTGTGGSLLSAEDMIIVVVEEEEEDSDFNSDLDDSAAVSALKLQYNIVRAYCFAVINLYFQQKTRGENPAPHLNGLAKKALMRYILREIVSRSRQEWTDRILNTIKDGYSPAKIPEHIAAIWWFSDINSSFRTNIDFLFGNYMLLRSNNRLGLELADCFYLDLPKEGIKMEGIPTKAFVVFINQGKTNQHGRIEYGSCLRYRDPEACFVGQFAFWLFFRWQVEINAVESFPDFSRLERWYKTKILRRNKADYTGRLLYQTARKWTRSFYDIYSINTGKATYTPRVVVAQNADMAGVADTQV